MSKLITVFGSTGNQGGPVARALLQSGFKVRAVTRSLDSDKAKALKDAGAELVQGSITDIESVKEAVAGAYGVFLLTLVSPDELEVGKAAADECKKAGLQHVVFSSNASVKDKVGDGCRAFDYKHAIGQYLNEIGVPNTCICFAYYSDNFAGDFLTPFVKQSDGTYTLTLPMVGPVDTISVSDGAPVVVEIFKNREKYLGKTVGVSGGKQTVAEFTEIISKVTGKTLKYNQVSFDQYTEQHKEKYGDFASDVTAMYKYYSTGDTVYDEQFTRSINPNALTFQQWAGQNKEALLKKFSTSDYNKLEPNPHY